MPLHHSPNKACICVSSPDLPHFHPAGWMNLSQTQYFQSWGHFSYKDGPSFKFSISVHSPTVLAPQHLKDFSILSPPLCHLPAPPKSRHVCWFFINSLSCFLSPLHCGYTALTLERIPFQPPPIHASSPLSHTSSTAMFRFFILSDIDCFPCL